MAPKVGLYFTDEAPREQAFSLLMQNDDIDIPAGEAGHVIEDSLGSDAGSPSIVTLSCSAALEAANFS